MKIIDKLLSELHIAVLVGAVVGGGLLFADINFGFSPFERDKEYSLQEYIRIVEAEACSPSARRFAMKLIDMSKADIEKGYFDKIPQSGVDIARNILKKKTKEEGRDYCPSER